MAATLHLQQDQVDVGHPQLEIADEILLIDGQLPLDFLERLEVSFQQREAFPDEPGVPLGQRRTDAERVQELELHAPGASSVVAM